MSNSLLKNSYMNKTKILNLNSNENESLKNLNLSKNYIGNFKYITIEEDGTFNVKISNNRIIEVFRLEDNVLGYFFKGIYDKNLNKIVNKPDNNISNIGYISIKNNKFVAKLRAGPEAGLGGYETWEINNNENLINSYYSINSNKDNKPEQWIGQFEKIDL